MSGNFLGIFFNIDELGGAYGLAAYRLLFRTVNPISFHGCSFSDGDIGDKYCIGIESSDSRRLFMVEGQVGLAREKGFVDAEVRFTFDARVADYLAPAGRINELGIVEGGDNPWMQKAWSERQSVETEVTFANQVDSSLPPTLIYSQSSPDLQEEKVGTDEYAPGDVMGQTYVVRDVRKGGMGIVYIVEDLKSRKDNIQLRLALKTFQSRYLWNEEAIRRFEREAVVWIELGKHPNIVHAMLVQRVENRPYLWLEYVEGESLADLLARKELELDEAVDYALQFCRGMRYAHETHNLIHRDVKPANILISRGNVLKITDFGLSKLQAQLLEETRAQEGVELRADEMETLSGVFVTAAGAVMGTPAYIAPEAITAPHTVDTRADIYSFGNVLYEMLTRQRPFSGKDILNKHLTSEPLPVRGLRSQIPAELEAVVSRCLQKVPDKRFQTFAELESALLQLGQIAVVEGTEQEAASVPPYGHWFMKGFTFMELGKYEDAIRCFQEVIALDHNQEEAHNNLGVCIGNLGKFEEAAGFVEKAVALKPEYAEAWSNLGGIYERLQRYDEGVTACRRAIGLKPHWAEAHSNLGTNLASLGQLDEATSCFHRAIEADASYWPAYLKLAQAHADRGSLEEALEVLQRAIQINPREADLLASTAACLTDLKQVEEASKYLQLALQVNPRHPLALRVQQFLTSEGGVELSPT